VSNFEQYTLAEFMARGYFEKHINRMRLYYGRQRKKILEYINKSRLHECCSVIENDSGLHFLLKLDTELPDKEFTSELLRHGIHITALSEYYLKDTPESSHKFILNYSNINIEGLKEAFDLIYMCCRRMGVQDV
jgi:GntR family transcriptional regulator/MocR family aminotransferase